MGENRLLGPVPLITERSYAAFLAGGDGEALERRPITNWDKELVLLFSRDLRRSRISLVLATRRPAPHAREPSKVSRGPLGGAAAHCSPNRDSISPRVTDGPPTTLAPVDVEDVVRRWRNS